ncbi:MAG: hypothetical protein IME96_07595 [Proteobacteria bacterium]|nr:hypothetical protein [Pseudomonadota bacterium]
MRIAVIIFISLLAFALPLNAQQEDEGKYIFEGRCGGMCHQLPDPALLKAKQWRMVLNVMQKRMMQQGQEPLTDEEFEQVFDYLKKSVIDK